MQPETSPRNMRPAARKPTVGELLEAAARRRGAGAPRVYLAGPFTALALPPTPQAGQPGVIHPEHAWRKTLLVVESTFSSAGWSVFLPHRDVSAWGRREIEPADVARECLEAVLNSDLVLALLGESFGTHIEVGAALGREIPTIVIRSPECAESYFGGGVASSPLVGELVVHSVSEVPGFLRRHVSTPAPLVP